MLPALHLNFRATAPSWSPLGLALLLVGLVMSLYALNEARAVQAQIALAQAKVARATQGIKPQPRPAVDSETLQTEVRAANEVLQQLALPWSPLFSALESTGDKQIALLSIQPDAGKRMVRISGEAKDFDALLAYMARIEQSKILRQVYLNSHEVRAQDAEKPVRFALTATWVPQP